MLTNKQLASQSPIHRYWWADGPDMPDRYKANGEAWKGFGFEVIEWDESNLPSDCIQLVENNLWRVEDETDHPRTRSGFVRWWLLNEYGGVYSDHDITPINPPLPPPVSFISLATRRACSAFIGAPRRGTLPRTMLNEALQLTGQDAKDVVGQKVLARVFRELRIPTITPFTCCGGDGSLEHEWTTAQERRQRNRSQNG